MENFTNDILDTKQLPRFEEVTFSKLDVSYWKIIWIELLFVFVIISAAAVIGVFNDEKLAENALIIYGLIPALFLIFLDQEKVPPGIL